MQQDQGKGTSPSEMATASDAVRALCEEKGSSATVDDIYADASAANADATATTTGPAPEPAAKQIHFEVTTSEGWHYTGSVPFPTQALTLSKDVSSSPPGTAKLIAEVQGDTVERVTVPADNPGRSNGPELTVRPGYFAYKFPDDVRSASLGGTPCDIAEDGSNYEYEPYTVVIACSPGENDGSASGEATNDTDEANADALIAAMSSVHPTYVMSFAPYGRTCNIFISPTGKVRTNYDANDAEGFCSAAHVTVDDNSTSTPVSP
jgi:hypothetical protein